MAAFVELLRRQQAAGFQDVAGTEMSATIPISDRLLNDIINAELPPSAPVSEVRVDARADNTFVVNVKVKRASFLPAVGLTLGIARQPHLPDDPELVLEMAAKGLMSLAGPALRIFDLLPPGVRVDGSRIYVNIWTLLEQRGLRDLIPYLEDLRVATTEGRVIVSVRARIATTS